MHTANPFTALTISQRNRLESFLLEFDECWTTELLDDYSDRLKSETNAKFRQLAIAELVKIDLQRRWAVGQGRLIEEYCKRFADLGRPEDIDVELIQIEFGARSAATSDFALESYAERFPMQYDELTNQASIDTSRVSGIRKTETAKFIWQSPLPQEFGRYRILREIGVGGMGRVYLARDTQLDRQVAIKTPHFAGEKHKELITRFYREARAAAKIQSRNICPIYDVGEIDGRHYISMGFIDGRPLSEFTQPSTIPSQNYAVTLVHRLAVVLAEAHRHGVIHRDLKPANIMIDSHREPVVMDFGLARQSDAQSKVTQSGDIIGTPAYMSPEQLQGDPNDVTVGVDIYALGVILYELLTGTLPFQGSIAQVVHQITHKDPQRPSHIRAGIDPDLEQVCATMMAKRRNMRYQSMEDVAKALKHHLSGPETLPTQQPSTDRWSSTRKYLFAGFGAVLAIIGFTLLFRTPHGTIRVETSGDLSGLEVFIDGNSLRLTDQNSVKTGEHELALQLRGTQLMLDSSANQFVAVTEGDEQRLTVSIGDQRLSSKKFKVVRNNETVLKIKLLPTSKDSTTSKSHALIDRESGEPLANTTDLYQSYTIDVGTDVSAMAVAPDGQSIAIGGDSTIGSFSTWNLRTGQVQAQFSGHADGLSHLVYTSDGQRILSSAGNVVKVWDTGTGDLLDTFTFFPDRVRQLAVFDSQPWAIALTRTEAEPGRQDLSDLPSLIRVWNWKTGEVIIDKQVDAHDTGLALSPDDRFLTLGERHTQKRYDLSIVNNTLHLSNSTRLQRASLIRSPMSFSPDGKYGVCNVKWDEALFVLWNIETGTLVRKFDAATASLSEPTQFAARLAFSPNGRMVANGDFRGRVRLWDRESGKLIAELPPHHVVNLSHSGEPPSVAFANDGRLISGGGTADRTFHVVTLDPSILTQTAGETQ